MSRKFPLWPGHGAGAERAPGLTGLWQVSGRNNVSYQRRVLLDLTYVNRRSLGLDLRILWRTVSVVLFPANKGAY